MKTNEEGYKGQTTNLEEYAKDYGYSLDPEVKKNLWEEIYRDCPFLKEVSFLPK